MRVIINIILCRVRGTLQRTLSKQDIERKGDWERERDSKHGDTKRRANNG